MTSGGDECRVTSGGDTRIISLRCYFSRVVSIDIRQDVMVRLHVLAGLIGSIARKPVELATVSILLNSTL